MFIFIRCVDMPMLKWFLSFFYVLSPVYPRPFPVVLKFKQTC
ncbi:unnamed protein product [Spirodela intermedia]|uniref:Uncharacterized protein n=1 Tax=Spirodela intermedia TaxID=51605 RepID=A0A7I8J6N9_SPIIN|nr:unnamed protein product [Spirodela intermedia]CAA6665102.1 unnamed protein product [Spirodela intermedia]